MDYCEKYTGYACVYGHCPKALAQEFPWQEAPENCETCWEYKGCEDCITPELGGCDKESQQCGRTS